MRFDLQQWEIQGMYQNKSLLDIPPFQREAEVWTVNKKRLFIDTILKGWKAPKIYLNMNQDQKYEIIDGQQRISTIIEFLNNGFKVSTQEDMLNFSSLEPALQNQILKYGLDIEIISDATENNISELFFRLQQGVALNAAEKLNALTGKLSDFINEIETHNFFNKTGFRKKRYGTKNICQQLVALEAGTQGAKYPEVSEFFEKNRDFEDEDIKNHIIATLDYLDKIFLNLEEYLTKAGNVVSIYLLCSWILKEEYNMTPEQIYTFFSDFYYDFENKTKSNRDIFDFYLTLLQSTVDATSVKLRDEILKRYLYLKEPKLIVHLSNDEKDHFYNKMEDIFSQKVTQIHELMREINERAISNGKHVIFDITAESAFTFSSMMKRLKTEDAYETFIDLTWKTFYEGSSSGNRLDSFKEDRDHTKSVQSRSILIKLDDLRKVNAHDLEHDRSTYEEKIRYASEIRNFYTGKKLTKDFEENDFLVFQYNVINELVSFLIQYNEKLKTIFTKT